MNIPKKVTSLITIMFLCATNNIIFSAMPLAADTLLTSSPHYLFALQNNTNTPMICIQVNKNIEDNKKDITFVLQPGEIAEFFEIPAKLFVENTNGDLIDMLIPTIKSSITKKSNKKTVIHINSLTGFLVWNLTQQK